MEQDFVCGKHREITNIFCETCDRLICLECLGSHSERNCKSIGLFQYAKEQTLPKYKTELDMFERDKESFQRSISRFISSSKNIKQQVIQLKDIIENLLEIMEVLESLAKTIDKTSSYYDTIRGSFTKKYEDMKEAIAKKDIAYIIKNKGEHDLKKTVEIYSKQKELIESVRKSMDNLLKSKEIEEITKGLEELYKGSQELYSSHTTLMKHQDNKVTSKFLYGLIRSQDDCKLLCKYDIKAKKLIPTIPVKYCATVTQIGSRVFITGGYNPLVNTAHEFIESTQSLVPKMSMNYAKYAHSTQVISVDAFVALGGCDGNKAYAYCEEYSTYKNEWAILPSLNNARDAPGTLFLNNKYLYAIGGEFSDSTIERLDITQKNSWILVNLASNELSINKSPRAFLISDSEALILSGNDKDEVVGIYNINANTIKKSEMTTVKDYYYRTNVCNIGFYIVVIGTRGNVVSYNLKTKKFESISYSSTCSCLIF